MTPPRFVRFGNLFAKPGDRVHTFLIFVDSFLPKAFHKFASVACFLCAISANQVAAQVTIAAGTASATAGGAVALAISIATSGIAPGAVQWTIGYPTAAMASVTIAAGASASSAGKAVTCNGLSGAITCVADGANQNTIGAGLLATATFTIAANAQAASVPITVTGVVAVSSGGSAIPASGLAGAITVTSAQTWTISGTISPAAGGSGATVTLSGTASASTTANSSGAYSFTGLANGSYTVTPSKSGYTFAPASSAVTVNGASQTAVNFTATATSPQTWTISGTISPAAGGSGATVTLSGTAGASTTANSSGAYSFTGLANGSYTVTPSKSGYTFAPASSAVTVNGASQTAVNFTATATSPQTWTISGTISPAAGGSGATVTLSGTAGASTTANSSGAYSFTGLANGSYTVTPSKSGYTFAPASSAVTVNGASQTAVNFTATATSPQTWTISGTISPAAGGSGATVTLSGTASASTTVNSSGAYSFTGLANGSYTVTPSKSGYNFTPANSAVTVNGASRTAVNFTASSGPALRNNYTGFVGMQFTVGSNSLSVVSVGRICVAGNSATHTVELVSAQSGATVASASVNMANCPAGQFVYASLASPATLQAGASYYLVSLEQNGGDLWYDSGPIAPLADVSVTNSIYSSSGIWTPDNGPNTAFVPPSMEYSVLSNSTTPFVVTYNLNSPELRNNFTGYVGMQLTAGSSPVTVVSLGRICVAGNSGSHTLEFVNASTGAAVSGGTVTLSMSGCQAGQFAYATLSSPITLQPGTSYYLVSSETKGGDEWYNTGTLTSTSAASVNDAAYSSNGQSWTTGSAAKRSYGPLNFQYVNSAFVTGYGFNDPPLRNNFSGWLGMQFTTGAGGMTVHSLGRIFVSGNSGTHTVKLVLASNGTDVPGATVSVSTAGGTSGEFVYANLPSPVTLQTNTAYYLVSEETSGGDQWYVKWSWFSGQKKGSFLDRGAALKMKESQCPKPVRVTHRA